MATKVLEYYVNEETGKFIDPDDFTELSPSQKPAVFYGTECILKLHFIRNDEADSSFIVTDTFRLAGDKDWNHARGEGTLAQAYSGSVTSIEVANLNPDDTLPAHGVLRLTNGSSEGEEVYYTAYSIDGGTGNYTFTVDTTLTYSYNSGDDCVAEDGLMIFSDTDKASLTLPNIVEITVNSDNHIFEYKLSDSEYVWGYLQVERNTSGVSYPSIILNDIIMFRNRVRINEGEPAENTYNFLTPTQLEQYYLKRDFTGNYPQKTPVVGADLIPINDSEASNETKYAEIQDIVNLASSSPAAHASSHEDGGSDEIDVTGLSGELADPQTPKSHASTHKASGSDEIKLDELGNPTDNTGLNATTSAHGLLPKLSGDSDEYLDGEGNWTAPDIPDDSITEAKLADDAVSTAKIQEEAVASDKLVSTERMTKANIENTLTGQISSHYHTYANVDNGINESASTGNMDEDGNALIFDYDEFNIAEIQSQEGNIYDRFLVHGNGGDGETKITGGARGAGSDEEVDSVSGVEYDTAEKHLDGSISSLKFDGTGYALWETWFGSTSDGKQVINLKDNDFLIEFYANFNTLAVSSKYALLHHYLLNSSSELYSTFKVYYEVGRGLVFAYKTTGLATEDWKEISASVTFSTATWYRIRIFRKSDRLYIYVDDIKYTDEVLTDTIYFYDNNINRYIVLGAEVTGHNFGDTAPDTFIDSFDGWMQECIIKVGDAYYDTDNMDNTERQWYIDREYVRADAPPVFGGIYPTEITSSQTLPQDVFNHVVKVNVSNGTKIYLPYVSELNIGNRLVIQNVSTSNYFWLYEYDGASNSPYKLIPPKSNIELIYSDNGWLVISEPVLADNLIVNIDDTYNIRHVTNALPLHGIRSFWGVPGLTLQLADGDYYLSSQWNIADIDYTLIFQGNTSDSSPYDSVRIYSDVMVSGKMINIQNGHLVKFQYVKIECTNTGTSSGYICYILNANVRFKWMSSYDYSYYHIHIRGNSGTAYVNQVYFEKGEQACSPENDFEFTLSSTYKVTNAPNYGRYTSGGRIIEQTPTQVPGSAADRYKQWGGQIILPNGQAWKSDSDIVALRTYLSTSQSIPDSTPTKIAFDSIEFDVNSDWDTTNHKFVCQKRGVYEVKLQGYLIYVGAQHRFYLYIYKNGSSYSKAMFYNKINADTDMTTYSTTTIFLEEGDVIEFYALQDSGSTQTLNNERIFTFATITLIHELDS